jgi:predicted lipid-binding transport protein (Tim44 family)
VLINDVKDPRETGIGAIAGDAAIGAVAGGLLGGLFGGRSIIATENILGGAAISTVVGNITAPQVVVIEPSRSIGIVTSRNLTFRTQDRFNN